MWEEDGRVLQEDGRGYRRVLQECKGVGKGKTRERRVKWEDRR